MKVTSQLREKRYSIWETETEIRETRMECNLSLQILKRNNREWLAPTEANQ
jgi:hypothetical protein